MAEERLFQRIHALIVALALVATDYASATPTARVSRRYGFMRPQTVCG